MTDVFSEKVYCMECSLSIFLSLMNSLAEIAACHNFCHNSYLLIPRFASKFDDKNQINWSECIVLSLKISVFILSKRRNFFQIFRSPFLDLAFLTLIWQTFNFLVMRARINFRLGAHEKLYVSYADDILSRRSILHLCSVLYFSIKG